MRKIYAALLSLLFLLVWNSEIKAQVNAYTFSQSSGPYTAITGGTIVATATANSGAAAIDDVNFPLPGGTIPFSFNFNGVNYTTLNINSNGYVTFGATAPPAGTPYTPISDATAYSGAIAAWGGDIIGLFNVASTTSELRYETVGSAPNREFVVQWKNFRPSFTTSTTSAFVFDFQIRLSESTNVIKIVYGGTLGYVIGSTTYSGTRQIGLRGASNADYNSRTNGTGVAFTASVASTANTNAQSFNTTAATPGMPSPGLVYTWTPPVPCTAPPPAGTTASTVTNACASAPFTLSVTGGATGTGLTYQWQSSATGLPGSFTDIPTATGATYIVTGQTSATYYQRKTTCSAQDAFSAPVLVGQNAPADCYCPVTFPSNVEPITLVKFADINNSTSPTVNGTPALENFTSIVGNVSKGDSYLMTVKGNTDGGFTTHINVYIDFNQDGDFDDAGENFYIGTIVGSTGVDAIEASGSILIPPTALNGITRMRVMKKFSTQAPPCNNAGFGQAEDYSLSITTPPCPVPTGISVSNITQTGAEVTATGTGTLYVEYGPIGFTPGTGATAGFGGTVVTGASPFILSGLANSTMYSVYVRQDCGGSFFSANSAATNFQTLCGVSALPLVQDFASYAVAFPPPCWTRNNTTQLIGNAASAFGFGAGSAKFDFWNANTGTQLDLITNTFTATPAGYWLTFDHAYATFTTQNDVLQIWTSTDDGANYTLLTTYNGGAAGPLNTAGGGVGAAFTPNAGQWGSKAIAIPTGTNKIRFRGVSAFGNNLYLDNIRVTSCVNPTDISSSAVTQTTATISWTASVSAPANGYQWEIRSSGAPGSGATGLGASGSTAAGVLTANATGLAANTTYNVYVRSNCGSEFSAWGGPHSFKTDCDPIAIPILEDFATYATTFPPTCWTRNNTVLLLGDAVSGYGIGTGSARFNFWAAPTGTFDLRTPQFTPTPAGYWLMFDHAYATFSGEVDRLEILYSTDGGQNYSNLTTYNGGAAGPLNTGGTTFNPFASFVPTASQWASKAIALPTGTNRLIFRGVSAFGDDLFLDNIRITSCLPPTGVTSSNETQTTATINWTASVSNPSGGYQWEVRTSGAPGSGATGLAASGTTAAGVTTANVTGLTAGTAYDVYVRSDCGGSDFSTWTLAYRLTTHCNPITSFPYTETFENASPTRICWRNQQLSGSFSWTYGAGSGNGGPVTTAHGGSVNAQFFGSFYGGEQALLVSPELNLTGNASMVANGADLEFWVANPSWLGDINPLRVLYKTSAGGTWNPLPGGVFSSPINNWTKIEIPNLPNISGTYYIAFEGTQLWGWGIAIDDVVIKAGPSCRKPTNVSAIGITSTSIEVNFTSPGTNFIVEYGAPGFVPGTGATAGVGGTIVTGTASPIIIPGLTASTTYDVYIRRVCIPGADYSENVKATATTQCAATNIPYLQTFESASVPAMPTCTSIQDVNGNSGSFWLGTGGGGWETYTDNNPLSWVSPNKSLLYYYDFNDLTRGGDDWFFTHGLNLTAGTTYRLKFFYKGLDGANFPERLEVKYGMGASASNMTNNLFNNANVSSVYGGNFDSVRVDFTPSATGVYYMGFHAYSLGDMFGMLLDNISVNIAPVVDVGISNVTLPNLSCPTNNVFIQAEVKNYNITPVNFANTPVNVNARIVLNGTTTTNLPATVLNSGILNPNETMGIYLTTSYNFVAGTHDITLNTTSPLDPEVVNDTLKRTVVVNPNPPTPVITPAAPQVCLGNSVQLTVPTPPASTATVTQATGPIAVAVPDGSAVGATSTLAVTGIPSTATITGISVTMNMTHTWINDMTIGLRAPNGKILNLFNRRGAAATENLVNTTISSASTTSLATGAAPFTGTFAADAAIGQGPTGLTSDAAGFPDLYPGSGSGNWTLVLRDHVGFDAGTLTSWSITINYSYVPALTWSPVTELFTNAAATTPYVAGTNAYTVYAKPTTTRTYTATSTGAGGCTATGTVTVTVNPNPVVTIGSIPDTVCISDQSIALVGNPVGGTWSGIGVSGNNFLPPTTAVGNYLLTYNYVNAFGCPGSATKRIWVKDCPDRIVLLRDNAVILFPNPTDDGRFNIRINSVLYNNLTMRVYTNSGAIVRTQKFTGLVYGRVVPIDLSALPGGVYIVEFANENAGPRTAEKSFKVIIGH